MSGRGEAAGGHPGPSGPDPLAAVEELLQALERGEADPAGLALAELTAEGLARLRSAEELDLEEATSFLMQAAKLLDAKARALLPPEPQAPFKELDDPADDGDAAALVDRLLAYRGFKEAAAVLRRFEEAQWQRFPRGGIVEPAPAGLPGLEGLQLDDLLTAFQRIWEQASEAEPPREIPREEITVAARVRAILRTLREAPAGEVTFTSLFRGQATRREVIVTFLAILELVRLGRLAVRQEVSFGEILIRECAPARQPWAEGGAS